MTNMRKQPRGADLVRLNGHRPADEPEMLIEVFQQVPRAFWQCINDQAMHGLLCEANGHLTLPEREHLWRLMGHLDDPPRHMRLFFDSALMQQVARRLSTLETEEAVAAELLDMLRRGRVAN